MLEIFHETPIGLPAETPLELVAMLYEGVGFGVGAGVGFGVGAGVGFGVGAGVGFGVGFGVGAETTVTELLDATGTNVLLRKRRNSYCPPCRGAFNVKLPLGDPPVYLHHCSLPFVLDEPTL